MNPAVLPDGWEHDAYMRIAIPMLMECEAVAFLPGWQQSRGARQEFTRAHAFGLVLLRHRPKSDDFWNENDSTGQFDITDVGLVIVSDERWTLVCGRKGFGWCFSRNLAQVSP